MLLLDTLSCMSQGVNDDSIIDNYINKKMIGSWPNDTIIGNNDTIIKYGMLCLAIDKKITRNDFVEAYLTNAFYRKVLYDSALKYGNMFLGRKFKKQKEEYSNYWRACNLKLQTSEILYRIDTTRHNYKRAVKYLLRYNPERWRHGSATNMKSRMRVYYSNIIDCYFALGDKAKANKYKRKLLKYFPNTQKF